MAEAKKLGGWVVACTVGVFGATVATPLYVAKRMLVDGESYKDVEKSANDLFESICQTAADFGDTYDHQVKEVGVHVLKHLYLK